MKRKSEHDIRRVIADIAARNKRNQKLVAEGCPAVGVFWLLKGKNRRLGLYSCSTPWKSGEDDGEFVNYQFSHEYEWRQMKGNHKRNVSPPDDPLGVQMYMDKEYDEVPRGRIVYSKLNKKFYVHATKALLKPRIKSKIMKGFRLPPAHTVFMNDEHYG